MLALLGADCTGTAAAQSNGVLVDPASLAVEPIAAVSGWQISGTAGACLVGRSRGAAARTSAGIPVDFQVETNGRLSIVLDPSTFSGIDEEARFDLIRRSHEVGVDVGWIETRQARLFRTGAWFYVSTGRPQVTGLSDLLKVSRRLVVIQGAGGDPGARELASFALTGFSEVLSSDAWATCLTKYGRMTGPALIAPFVCLR